MPSVRHWLARASRSRISQSVIALGVSTIIGKGFMLLALVVATRSAGPAAWGQFAYSLTLLYLIQVIADFGFHTYIMRESARGEWTTGQERLVIRGRLILAVAASLIVLGILHVMDKPRVILTSVTILSLSLLFRAYYGTRRSFLQGQERMWSTAWMDSILYGSFFLAALILDIRSGVTAEGLSWGWTIASLLCALSGPYAYRHRRLTAEVLAAVPSGFSVLSSMQRAFPFLAVNVAVVFLHRVGILILEHFRPPEVVGQFAAAYNIFDALSLIPGLLVTAVFPRLARGTDWNVRLRYLTPAVVAITTIPVAVVWIFAEWLALVLYGAAYTEAVFPLRILLLGLPLMAATGSIAHQLFALGKERYSSLSTVFAFVLNTGLCLVLAPRYGITGVAVATTLALLANNVIHFVIYYRKAG